jgi:predicted O-methyltransferase YrrM
VSAVLDRAERIHGWMDRAELTWLSEQAAAARTIVEVGCWCGRSTSVLAEATPGTVWCVDPWTGTQDAPDKPVKFDRLRTFAKNLAGHIATGRVQVLPARSRVALEVLQYLAPFDFVFLDGDHAYDSIAPEIEAFRPLVRPGGVLAGHDYANDRWPDVTRAVDERVPDRQRWHSIWWTRA